MILTFADLPTDSWFAIASYLDIVDIATCYQANMIGRSCWLTCYLQRLPDALQQDDYWRVIANEGWSARYSDSLLCHAARRQRPTSTWRLLCALVEHATTWTARQEELLLTILRQPSMVSRLQAICRYLLLEEPLNRELSELFRTFSCLYLELIISECFFNQVMAPLLILPAPSPQLRGERRWKDTCTLIYRILCYLVHASEMFHDSDTQIVLCLLDRFRAAHIPLSRRTRRRLRPIFRQHESLDSVLDTYPAF